MRSQYSDRQGRRDSERGSGGGDRRGGFDRDYDRHSQGRHRDQDRDTDFGSDRGMDSSRSQYGSQDFNSSSYGSRANHGSETGYRPRSEMDSPMRGGNKQRSWGLQGQRDLSNSSYDDMPGGQRHWGKGEYQDIHDRDNWRRDTRRHDERKQDGDSFFEKVGEKVGEFFGKGPKGYKRSDDRIREDASEALWAHPQIDASEIEVDVREGVVTLSGTVSERRMKRMIEDEIEDLPGVKDVINNVRTQDRFSSGLQGSSSTSAATSSGLGSSGSMNMSASNAQNTSSNGRTSEEDSRSGSRGRKTQ